MAGKRDQKFTDTNGKLRPGTRTNLASEESMQLHGNRFVDTRERVLTVVKGLVGYDVIVELVDGTVYEGVFHRATLDDCAIIILKMARAVGPSIQLPANAKSGSGLPPGWFERLELSFANVIQLKATNVRMGPVDSDNNNGDDLAGFGTDSAITGGRVGRFGRERELQKWAPSPDDAAFEGIEDAAMEGGDSSATGWDQFAAAANQISPGTAKPSFHENYYTTPLDVSTSRISPAAALKVAKQIEADNRSRAFGGTGNVHLDEERGLAIDDSGMDEEDKYSSVRRTEGFKAPETSSSDVGSETYPVVGGTSAPQPVPVPNASRSPWSHAGSSIAAVSGRAGGASAAASSLPRPIPGRAPATESPTSSVNARREHNRVAMQMGTPGSRKDRSGGSPFGSFSRSPLSSSPLVRDPTAMEALNLDAGSGPKLGKAQVLAFREFKAKQNAEKARQELEQAKRRVMSYKASIDGLALSDKASVSDTNSPLDGSTLLSDAPVALSASPAASNTSMPPLVPKTPGSNTRRESPAPTERAAAKDPSSSEASTPSGKPDLPSTGKKLNPNAKSFAFNPTATAFTPGTARSTSGSIGHSSTSRAGPPHTPASRTTSGGSGGGGSLGPAHLPRPHRNLNSTFRRISGGTPQSHGHPGGMYSSQHPSQPPPLSPQQQGHPIMQGSPSPQHQRTPGPPQQPRPMPPSSPQGGRTPPQRPPPQHVASPVRQHPMTGGHSRSGSGSIMPVGPYLASPMAPSNHPHMSHMGPMGSGALPAMRRPPQPPGTMGHVDQMMHPDHGPPRDGRNGAMPRPGMLPGHSPLQGGMMQVVQGPVLIHQPPPPPPYNVASPPMAMPGSPHGPMPGFQPAFSQSSPMARPPWSGNGYPGGPPVMMPYPGPPPPPPPEAAPGLRPPMFGPPPYSPGRGRTMGPPPPTGMPRHVGLPSPPRPSPPHNGLAPPAHPLPQHPSFRPGPPQYRPGMPYHDGGPAMRADQIGPMPMAPLPPHQMGPGGPAPGPMPPGSPHYQHWNGAQPMPSGHLPSGSNGIYRQPPGPGAREMPRPPAAPHPSGPRRT